MANDETQLTQEFREKTKTELLQVMEEISEIALTGGIERSIVIWMAPDGQLALRMLGMRPSDALGMMMLAQGIITRKLMS